MISPEFPSPSSPVWTFVLAAACAIGIPVAAIIGRRSALRDRAKLLDSLDAAERKQASLVEREQKRSLELARANASLERERRLFVGGPVAIFRWVAAEGWPVEYVSPNVAGILGYSAEDFTTGRVPYATIVHPDDIERVAAEVGAHSAAGVPYFEQDYRIIRADGEVRWLYDFTVIARDDSGRITHYEGYVLDITERHRAQDESREMQARLHHAQKLESLGVLAGGIAHDFNNLLVGVLGNAALAKQEAAAGAPVRDAIDRIESAARRAAELAQQMLAYSGRSPGRIERVDMSTLVVEMLNLLRVSISKKAEIVCDIAADLPQIEGDPGQVKQVLMNLITNASDAIGDECGRIELRAGVFAPDREFFTTCHVGQDLPEGRYLFVEVRDTGCGMTRATVARMFEPFFTTKFVGRGLGLASVLGIMRGHNGAICVESAPGNGTSVRVLFPIAESLAVETSVSPATAVARPAPQGKRVLVVDDEPAVRDVVCRFVERSGCVAIAARDGEEAIALLTSATGAIDCALLDATMPKLSGEETFHALRRIQPGLPVILMSGYIESEVTSRFQSCQFAGFLQKPFTPAELQRKLSAVVT